MNEEDYRAVPKWKPTISYLFNRFRRRSLTSNFFHNMNPKKSTHNPLIFDELMIRCMGELEFAHKILRDFLDSSVPLLDEIKSSISSSSIPEAAQRVHRLKGTAATVAAKPLFHSLAKLEELLQAKGQPVINELKEQFVNSCEKFDEVQSYIECTLLPNNTNPPITSHPSISHPQHQ